MIQKHYVNLLKENIEILEDSMIWLNRSYSICKEIGIQSEYNPEQFDAFETLCSRFSRTIDLIVNKVFRTIDVLEFVAEGTLIDAVNRAIKRGIVESLDDIRRLKDLRNAIVHEYVKSNLQEMFRSVLSGTEEILILSEKIQDYCQKYIR